MKDDSNICRGPGTINFAKIIVDPEQQNIEFSSTRFEIDILSKFHGKFTVLYRDILLLGFVLRKIGCLRTTGYYFSIILLQIRYFYMKISTLHGRTLCRKFLLLYR